MFYDSHSENSSLIYIRNSKAMMKAIINELDKAITDGKPQEKIEVKIAENIKEAVKIPEFYKLGLDVVNKILDKSGIIDSNSILNIISLGYKEYGVNVSVLLPHIKCDGLGKISDMDTKNKIEIILKSMDFIPIIRELNMIFQEMITKGNEYEEGEFDVDWEDEYNEIKAKYEMMEKKISITKQLQIRIENGMKERKYTWEERNKIEKIVKAKDMNGVIEVFSKDPSLFYCDFLHMCAENGWKEGVELALDICFLSNDFVNKTDSSGYTSLIRASLYGRLEIVKYLISKGANIEALSDIKWTALMYASNNGQLEFVKYLISKGANIEAKNTDGWTALMHASRFGHLEVVKYLISKGANIEAKDNDGRTAMMLASEKRKKEVVEYLKSIHNK